MSINWLMIFMNGVTYAGLLFMVASGFTLVFGLMRIVNLAHGMFYLLAAYIGMSILAATGNWWLAILGSALAVGVIACVIHFFLLKRVQGDDLRETLLTLGLSFIIGDLLLAYYGGLPRVLSASALIAQPVDLGFIRFPGIRLFVLAVAVLQGLLLWALLIFTQFGRIIRAGVDDRRMVSALGIHIDRVFTGVFFLAGFITGISGVIGGSYITFGPGEDMFILTYALVVVIIGGLGSLPGTAVGALIVGMIDSFSKVLAPQFTMFLLFGTLMLVLAFRPYGLFGKGE